MPLPPRRWFQFKLTTWFVLVAILAWVMLEWPCFAMTGWERHFQHVSKPLPRGAILISTFDIGGGCGLGPPSPCFVHEFQSPTTEFNPAVLYPTLALAAFVGWKAAWRLGGE